MNSRIFYEIVVNGNRQGSFYSDIKQPVGSDSDAADLEVTSPVGYIGAFDHQVFAKGIRTYYQHLVNTSGRTSSYGDPKKVMMKDHTLVMESEFEFDAEA